MIGDNLETDISFGFKAGIHTLCTLSGVSNEELVLQNNIVTPTYYSDTI
jgi:ribonucleotide monophosphatase NagD (HAD superfamily)